MGSWISVESLPSSPWCDESCPGETDDSGENECGSDGSPDEEHVLELRLGQEVLQVLDECHGLKQGKHT